MCQLLGISANKPVSLNVSLEGFMRRGGLTDHHRDGWGIASYRCDGWWVHRDPRPSAESTQALTLHREALTTRNAIVHIRKATIGEVSLANCHPFARWLWGRQWVFAHNGDLKNFDLPLSGQYRPHARTDSEHAFCFLLDSLSGRFGNARPSAVELRAALHELANLVARFGTFNFLLSDGDGLYAYCSTELHVLNRKYPFSRTRLVDHELEIDFARHNHLDDCTSVVATRPLTEREDWVAFHPGELKYFAYGSEQGQDERPRRLPQLAL